MFNAFAARSRGAPAWLGALGRTGSIVRRAVAVSMAAVLLSASGVLAGNGATTVHFNVAYASFTCAGERIVKAAPRAITKDSESCTFTDLSEFAPGTYAITTGPESATASHWASDYELFVVGTAGPGCDPVWVPFGYCIRQAISGTIVVTDNGDGTGTLEVTAYYP